MGSYLKQVVKQSTPAKVRVQPPKYGSGKAALPKVELPDSLPGQDLTRKKENEE